MKGNATMNTENDVMVSSSSLIPPPSSLLPLPRVPISVRAATPADVPFMDKLQKLHAKQVGWMPTATLEGKIKAGHVLIAEACDEPRRRGDAEKDVSINDFSAPPRLRGETVGYLIGNDRYFKRDDVGIIYQMNVVPSAQRGLVAATLLRAQFERSAYGCRLYCCWCAQDLAANRFWESMGFVPLAFRAGSRTKGAHGTPRVHIFWQKRIRQGDAGDVTRGGTPWWFPAKTDGGAIREDRIVLPIPPGTHWSDAKPLILPESVAGGPLLVASEDDKRRRSPASRKPRPIERRQPMRRNGLFFDVPKPGVTPAAETAIVTVEPKPPRVKVKSDPRLIAAARELRDRWLERVNADPSALRASGKYDVCKAIDAGAIDGGTLSIASTVVESRPALPSPMAA